MESKANNFSVSILICTRNRADILLRAVRSVQESTIRVKEIVVSDDSTDDQTKKAMLGQAVKYVEGPRRGLGANRNNALRHVEGNFVLFLDDDAMLGKSFLEEVQACWARLSPEALPKTIVTGVEEHQDGKIVLPNEQNFLGFQKRPYRTDEGLSTVVINSAVFPAKLFSEVTFDERLIYGCDEVDLTTQAVRKGYRIILCRTAVNKHYQALAERDYYLPYSNASRIYVTFKRYVYTERSFGKGIVFILLASLHHVLSNLKRQGLKGMKASMQTLKLSWQYWHSFLREQRKNIV